MLYIAVNVTQNLEPNRRPNSGPFAINVVYVVAQKLPVGNPFSATGHLFSLCDAVSYLY